MNILETSKNKINFCCSKEFLNNLAKLDIGENIFETIILKFRNRLKEISLLICINNIDNDSIIYDAKQIKLCLSKDTIDLIGVYNDYIMQYGLPLSRELNDLIDEKTKKTLNFIIIVDH